MTIPKRAHVGHTTSPARPAPDLTTFRLIHRAMVRDAARIAAVAAQLAERPDPRGLKALSSFASLYLTILMHHHHSEDEEIWPLIAASAGDAVDLAPLTADHEALDPLIGTIRDTLRQLAGTPVSEIAVQTLAAATARLADELAEHIAAEERDVLPVIERYVSVEDIDAADRRIRRSARPGIVLFLVPWLDSVARPDERAGIPLRFLLPFTRRGYRRRSAVLPELQARPTGAVR